MLYLYIYGFIDYTHTYVCSTKKERSHVLKRTKGYMERVGGRKGNVESYVTTF